MNAIVMLFAMAVSDPTLVGDSAANLNNQATQLYGQARYAEAETFYRKAIGIPAKTGTGAARVRAVAAANLGILLRVTGRYRESERVLTESLSELETNAGAEPVDMVRTLLGLAVACQSEGDLAAAESIANRALALTGAHREIPAHERVNAGLILAAIHIDRRRLDAADAELRALLPDADDAQAVMAYNGLSVIALQSGVYADAERFARQALERAATGLPRNHPSVAMVLNNLAQACRFQERYLEAEGYYRQAIAKWETVLGPSHPDLAKGLNNLAAFYHERGREAGAEALYLRAEGIFDRLFGPDSAQALVARNERADALRGERRYSESERLGAASLATLEKRYGADDPRVLRALGNRARLLAETRRQTEAVRVLERVRRITGVTAGAAAATCVLPEAAGAACAGR